jgi:hypothetical protein
MAITAVSRYGCSTRRSKGTCKNQVTVPREQIERRVLSGLKEKLVAPHLVEEFIREFFEETKRLRLEARRSSRQDQDKLLKVERSIAAIIKSVEDGAWSPALNERLAALESEKAEIKTRIQAAEADQPTNVVAFHPGLPALYRQSVEQLQTALQDEALRRDAMAILRTLIEKVIVTPTEAGIDVALYGELGALMALAEAHKDGRPGSLKPGRSLSVVAGARNHLYRTAVRWP